MTPDNYSKPPHPINYLPAPSILHTCAESRKIALKHYTQHRSIAYWGCEDQELPRAFYFNANIDVWFHAERHFTDDVWLGQNIDHPYTPAPLDVEYLLYRGTYTHDLLYKDSEGEWEDEDNRSYYYEGWNEEQVETFKKYFPNVKMLYLLMPNGKYANQDLRDFKGFGELREVPEEVWDVEERVIDRRVMGMCWMSVAEIRESCDDRGIDFKFVEERWV